VKAQVANLDSSVDGRRHLEQSLTIWQSLGAPWETASLLFELGYALRHAGAYDEARQCVRQSLEIRESLGDQMGISDSLHGLASMEERLGHLEEAGRLARECIAIQKQIGDRLGATHGLGLLGRIRAGQGEYDEAHSVLHETTRTLDELGAYEGFQAWWTLWLASVKAHLGRYGEALSLGALVLRSYQQRGVSWGVSHSLALLGSLSLATGDLNEAQAHLERSVSLTRDTAERDSLAVPLTLLAYAACGQGRIRQASAYLAEALLVATELGNRNQVVEALPAVALLMADLGQAERAMELYALAARFPRVRNSRWFADVAGNPIATVSAGLPPEAVAVARARGESRELAATAHELLEELGDLSGVADPSA